MASARGAGAAGDAARRLRRAGRRAAGGRGDRSRRARRACWSRGGYARTPVVEDPGTFAVRGGVLDVFVPLYRFPLRIELFGDVVESIRFFDPETQRTMRAVDEVYLHPVRETVRTRGNRAARAHARGRRSRGASVVEDPRDARSDRQGRRLLRHRGADAGVPRAHGVDRRVPAGGARSSSSTSRRRASRRSTTSSTSGDEAYRGAPRRAPAGLSARRTSTSRPTSCSALVRARRARRGARSSRSPATASIPPVRFARRAAPRPGDRAAARARREARGAAAPAGRSGCATGATRARARCIVVAQPAARRAARVAAQGLPDHPAPASRAGGRRSARSQRAQRVQRRDRARRARPRLSPAARSTSRVITEAEIFGEKAARRAVKKAQAARFDAGRLQEPRAGRLRGPQAARRRRLQGADQAAAALGDTEVAVDFLHLEYDGGALYLPVWRLNEVQRYVGAEGIKPKLDELGGAHLGEDARARSSKEVRQLAEELLQIYAQRQGAARPLASRSTAHVRETVPRVRGDLPVRGDARSAEGDRRRARRSRRRRGRWIAWSAATSATARPRWRCAPRSRWCSAGKQVAVLAPTTVLVEQHALTFAARFAGLPVQRGVAVALQVAKPSSSEVLKGSPTGKVDVVVGTHRLLVGRRALQGPRPARHRRGAALRRHAQGAAQEAAHPGRRADADRDADPAHAAHGADGAARDLDHHHAAGRSPRDPHHGGALRRRADRRGRRARAGARRAGLLRAQPRRGHRRVGGQAARAPARACSSSSATGRCRPRSSSR